MSNYFYVEPIEVNVNLINTAPDPFPFKRFILDIGDPVVQLEGSISSDSQYRVRGEYIYIPDGERVSGFDDKLITKKITEPISAWRKLTNNTNAADLENKNYISLGFKNNGGFKPNDKMRGLFYVTFGGNRVEVTIEDERITSYNTFPFSGYSGSGYYHPNIDTFTWPFEGGFGGQNFYLKRYGESTLSIDGRVGGSSYSQEQICELDSFIYSFPSSDSITFVKQVNYITGTTLEIPVVNDSGNPTHLFWMLRLNEDYIIGGSNGRIREIKFDNGKFVVGRELAYIQNERLTGNVTLFEGHAIVLQGDNVDSNSATLIKPDLSTISIPLGSTGRYYMPRVGYDSEGNVHVVYCEVQYNFGIGRTYSRKIGRFEY